MENGGSGPSRRTVIGWAPALAGIQLKAQNVTKSEAGPPKPFQVSVPEATVKRILRRLRETRLPERLEGNDWRYGADWDYMKELREYWISSFDWRRAQSNLNRYPQFQARVEDFTIHFYHVKGRGQKPLPLVLTHGWPGSVFEFLEAIGPLSDPARHGGSAEDAFDVVVPADHGSSVE
jgi:microsomal epoxide hydrolase